MSVPHGTYPCLRGIVGERPNFRDTKIDSRVKVGDPIAAQMTSSGMAESIKKLKELPKADELSIPKKTKEVEAETTLKDICNK